MELERSLVYSQHAAGQQRPAERGLQHLYGHLYQSGWSPEHGDVCHHRQLNGDRTSRALPRKLLPHEEGSSFQAASGNLCRLAAPTELPASLRHQSWALSSLRLPARGRLASPPKSSIPGEDLHRHSLHGSISLALAIDAPGEATSPKEKCAGCATESPAPKEDATANSPYFAKQIKEFHDTASDPAVTPTKVHFCCARSPLQDTTKDSLTQDRSSLSIKQKLFAALWSVKVSSPSAREPELTVTCA